jgi:acyl-lipid omega-6 desaturase (Delta-12 desaturase)
MDNSINKALINFQKPKESLSTYYILSTAIFGFSCIFLSVAFFNTQPWVTLLLYPFIFIILCRSVVLLHDAGHNALYKKGWKNSLAGNLMSLMNLIPNEYFSYMHNMHHATVGNLDKRHLNPELKTLTIEEYKSASFVKKMVYRFKRSAINRLIITPLAMLFVTRIPLPILKLKAKLYTLAYDIVIILILIVASKYGFMLALIVGYFIPLFACYVLVSIVFYLQHQFENTYWLENEEWSLNEASLEGSSFLIFGRFMKTVTCNIGYHHIHHLNPLIPCYNLEKAHNNIQNKITFKEVKVSQIFRHMRGKLWDKKGKKLVSFKSVYINH